MATIHAIDPTPNRIPGIVTMTDLLPELQAMYDNGITRGVHPGWDTLEDYYRPQLGQSTYVTGIPAMGKTRFISHMMVKLMEREDWRFAAFSPEATPARFTKQLIEQYTGKSFDLIPRKWQHVEGLERMSLPELYEAQEWLGTRYTMIEPPTLAQATITGMLDIALRKIEYDGVNGIVFDPWSWIAKQVGPKQMMTNYVGDQLALVNHFCVQQNVHLWLIAHPVKQQKADKGDYDGHYEPPDLYAIADSAHFFNFAYMGLTVWRNLKTHGPETEIHITKVKFEENGQMGKVVLMYDKYTKRYYDQGTEPARTYGY